MFDGSNMFPIPVTSSSNLSVLFYDASPSLDTFTSSSSTCPNSKISSKILPPWKYSLCFSREHQLYHCPQFHDKNQLIHALHISTAKLCVNCLSWQHDSLSCRSLSQCRWQDGNQCHHTSIHSYAHRFKNTLIRFPNK